MRGWMDGCVCMHICMYVCIYVYVCMYVCIYVCMYVNNKKSVRFFVCMYVFIHVCMYVCMSVYEYKISNPIPFLLQRTPLVSLNLSVRTT